MTARGKKSQNFQAYIRITLSIMWKCNSTKDRRQTKHPEPRKSKMTEDKTAQAKLRRSKKRLKSQNYSQKEEDPRS